MDNNVKVRKDKVIIIDSDQLTNPIPFISTSEATAKIIIEKIISLTITQSFIVNLEEKIPNECFDFTHKIIKGYLSSAFIQYERDEYKSMKDKVEAFPNFDIEEIHPKEQSETEEVINNEFSLHDNILDAHTLFYNNYYHGKNDWSTLNEPCSVEIDRYASAYIGLLKDHNQKGTDNGVGVNNGVNDSPKGLIALLPKTSGMYYTYNRSALSKEKKKHKYSIEINHDDIPSEEFILAESNDFNINELRREKDEELRKQEEEKKKVIIKQIESQEKIKETENIQKEFEKKKITIDANGKIVFIKQYPTDRLASEFITAKTDHKDINRRKSITKESKNKDKLKEKQSNKNLIHLEPTKGVTQPSAVIKEEKKDKEKEKEVQSPNMKDKKIIPVVPITQGKDKDNKKKDLPQQDQFVSTIAALEKKMERGPIYPCGSCFDIIALEIGVAFTEEKKYKTGGKDYLKAFNKYSIDNYNKQVKETVGYQTLQNQASRTTTDYNYTTTYNNNNTETYPSQFNYTSTSHDQQNKTHGIQSKMIMTNRSSLNPFIKTGRLQFPSLPTVMDVLDLTKGKFDNAENKYPIPEDIFKSKRDKQKTKRKHQLDPINNFTVSIMSHDKWGMNIGKYSKLPEVTSRIPFKSRKNVITDFKNRVPHKQFKLSIQQKPFYASMDNFAQQTTLIQKAKK